MRTALILSFLWCFSLGIFADENRNDQKVLGYHAGQIVKDHWKATVERNENGVHARPLIAVALGAEFGPGKMIEVSKVYEDNKPQDRILLIESHGAAVRIAEIDSPSFEELKKIVVGIAAGKQIDTNLLGARSVYLYIRTVTFFFKSILSALSLQKD